MGLRDRIKDEYKSLRGKTILEQFLEPTLINAQYYRRETGYFSSSALVSWVNSLPRLVSGEFKKIELIGSPNLSKKDIGLIKNLTDKSKLDEIMIKSADQVLKDIANLVKTNDTLKYEAEVFSWLFAHEKIEIRFALWYPNVSKDIQELYHKKTGIINFDNGDKIAFTGSMNETYSGHKINYEEIDVFRSWEPGDTKRIENKERNFSNIWEKRVDGLRVVDPSIAVKEDLLSLAPDNIFPRVENRSKPKQLDKWRHQTEAKKWFLKNKTGILEMATGTGKTRTSLAIADQLIKEKSINSLIVSMDGNDLLAQWYNDISDWKDNQNHSWATYREYKDHKEAADFLYDSEFSIILISRLNLAKVLASLDNSKKNKMLIIHDEVHGLGSPSYVKEMPGLHDDIGWRLGLSATPEREYDDEGGNEFIKSVFGDKENFQFELKDAIERGVLCPFDYTPIEFQITENDKQRVQEVFKRKAARDKAGTPMPEKQVWIEISRVRKTAELKPQKFKEYLSQNSEHIKNSLIFVETTEQADDFLPIIQSHTKRYHTYFSDDHVDNLKSFANGEFDTLITCHKISQGIDIQKLERVFLISSARAKLETIQRIGRCLRVNPSEPKKIAHVVDFVGPDEIDETKLPHSDQERKEWLQKLSKVRPKHG